MELEDLIREGIRYAENGSYLSIDPEVNNLIINQLDKNTIWAFGYRFGKFEQKFTASRTPSGSVKNGSIRFYD